MSQYTLDSTRRMSPGVVYKHYSTTSPKRQIHVMEIDLTESTVNLQAVKAGDTINAAEETVPVMYKAHDNFRGHDVTAAINSDFFTSNLTIKNTRHMMIGDGEILYDTTLNRTVFGITESRSPFITKLNQNYSVTAGAATRAIDHINRYGGTDQLVMYNRFKGDSTGTKPGGTEIKIVPVNGIGDWKANATISCKVLAKSTRGNMIFDSGQAVLYGLGTAKTFLDNLNVNDVISVNLQVINNSTGITNIKQLSGGWTKLVNDGANYVATSRADEGAAISDSMAPRTAIGYNQVKNKIYFVVVDGRRPGISEGMTLPQMADFMIFAGCYQALNFDGGGSSTMMGNDMLKNLPSDSGGPRKIASCLLAYLSSITLDNFENGVGHFNHNPTDSPTTVGVSNTSVVDTAKTCHSGYRSLIVKLYDNTAVTTAWKVRLLSGSGVISNNRYFDNQGTFSFYLRTSTANTGAKVRLWLNDTDGIELSPQLDVINDGEWHKYGTLPILTAPPTIPATACSTAMASG
jgi:exopolysaccharide biosynthesis protein